MSFNQENLIRKQSLLDEENHIDSEFQYSQRREDQKTSLDKKEQFQIQILKKLFKKEEKNKQIGEQILQVLSKEFNVNLVGLLENIKGINTSRQILQNICQSLQKKIQQNEGYINTDLMLKIEQCQHLINNQNYKDSEIHYQGRYIESLCNKDIGLSGSACMWVLQNLNESKYQNDLENFKNTLNWYPNDLDIFCFSEHKINLPVDYLEKEGYILETHNKFISSDHSTRIRVLEKEYEQFFLNQHLELLAQKEQNQEILEKNKDKIKFFWEFNKSSGCLQWKFSVFNFINTDTGKKIQFIVKRNKKLAFDIVQLENFINLEKPIIKPVHRILEINPVYFSGIDKNRILKYSQRGYCVLPQKLVKYTMMRCILLKRRLQKGKFSEKRINDYLIEIISDFLVVNELQNLKNILKQYTFQKLIQKLIYISEWENQQDEYERPCMQGMNKMMLQKDISYQQNVQIEYKNIEKCNIQYQIVSNSLYTNESKKEMDIITQEMWFQQISQKSDRFDEVFKAVSTYWGKDILKYLWEIQQRFKIPDNEYFDINNIPFPIKLLFFMIY